MVGCRSFPAKSNGNGSGTERERSEEGCVKIGGGSRESLLLDMEQEEGGKLAIKRK